MEREIRFTVGVVTGAGAAFVLSFEAEEADAAFERSADLGVAGAFADFEEAFEGADALAGFAALANFEDFVALVSTDLVTGTDFF